MQYENNKDSLYRFVSASAHLIGVFVYQLEKIHESMHITVPVVLQTH